MNGKKNGLFGAFSKIMPVAAMACSIAGPALAGPIPAPLLDEPLTQKAPAQSIVVAGGCFWGVQNVFQHTHGVISAVSGYAGGKADTAHYEMVSGGNTGHAESVLVTYNPSVVSLGTILRVYFSVAHDPTELNKQGPDHGTQYRSAIFYSNDDQKKIAEAYINQLQSAHVFPQPIVTVLEPLAKFYPAEDYHQDYARRHPTNTYIVINDLPKVQELKRLYPELYVE